MPPIFPTPCPVVSQPAFGVSTAVQTNIALTWRVWRLSTKGTYPYYSEQPFQLSAFSPADDSTMPFRVSDGDAAP